MFAPAPAPSPSSPAPRAPASRRWCAPWPERCARPAACSSAGASSRAKSHPYAGLLAALDQLLRRALAEPDERLAAVRAALDAALGDAAAGLADVLPALALVIGARPRPSVPLPAEAAGRFHIAVTRLVRVFAGRQAPLVIAVDDLQWADPASLRLYDELAREPSLDHLLLVGSYRDDELAPATRCAASRPTSASSSARCPPPRSSA
ncbi:ATP-binding protein [Nannocystis pusilla]|uniref:ATP-binding protein n=1 Tax=Nannocystis pusilla TaxID=889268 RepID=UPI003B7E2F10